MKIEHGELVETGSHGDLLAFVSNCTIDYVDNDNQKQTLDEACLLICRERFGLGSTHVVPLSHLWMYHDKYYQSFIDQLLAQAAAELFGTSVTTHDCKNIGDLIYRSLDTLFNHPPENEMVEKKKQERDIERMGLILKVNDREVINAS